MFADKEIGRYTFSLANLQFLLNVFGVVTPEKGTQALTLLPSVFSLSFPKQRRY